MTYPSFGDRLYIMINPLSDLQSALRGRFMPRMSDDPLQTVMTDAATEANCF